MLEESGREGKLMRKGDEDGKDVSELVRGEVGREMCKGLQEPAEQQISAWLEGQDIGPFDEMNELFSDVTRPLIAQKLDIDNPSILKMVFMALYNLDKFREFVFNSTFLDRFEVEPERVKLIKEDELALLKFAFDWTKFGLFGEKLFWVKENPEK